MRLLKRKLLGILWVTLSTAAPAHAEVLIGLAAPLTGTMSWAGGATERGAEAAVDDLNAKGGVLGEPIEVVTADDYCDGEQAVAAAKKLIASGVVAVFGHQCSGAAIPASKFTRKPKSCWSQVKPPIPASPSKDSPTRSAWWAGRPSGPNRRRSARRALGQRTDRHPPRRPGLRRRPRGNTKKRLNERGVAEAMFEAIEPGRADYWDIVQKMRTMGVKVLYFGGYQREAALLVHQAREHGYELQLVAGDAIGGEDFGLIAGPASDGTLMTLYPSPSGPQAAEFAAQFTEGFRPPFTTYAALQAWGQAVETAGTFETKAVAEALRGHEFDTVLGRIGFDAKGDVTGYDTFVWYVWKDGKYTPADLGKLTE